MTELWPCSFIPFNSFHRIVLFVRLVGNPFLVFAVLLFAPVGSHHKWILAYHFLRHTAYNTKISAQTKLYFLIFVLNSLQPSTPPCSLASLSHCKIDSMKYIMKMDFTTTTSGDDNVIIPNGTEIFISTTHHVHSQGNIIVSSNDLTKKKK